MQNIYNGRKYKIFSNVPIPKRKGDYVYFLRIGEGRLFKIGTTNDIMRRMQEHCRYYQQPIYILWISPTYSKYTTLRIEDRMKDLWRTTTDWEYMENDRFIIPEIIEKVVIKVKKNYEIILE